MSASDEQAIRLLLQVSDSGSIEDAVQKFIKLKGVAKEVADTYSLADQRGDQFVVSTKEITHALDAETEAAVEATMAQKAMNAVLAETTSVVTTLAPQISGPTKGSSGLGRSAMAASYAFQDFTSQLGTRGFAGALSAIQNNIPGILAGFGIGGTVIAGISAGAVALGLVVDNISKMNAEASKGALEKAKKDLEELAKKADEFNALIGKPTRAEAAGAKIIGDAISEGDPARIARVMAGELGRSGKGEQRTPGELAEVDRLNQLLAARARGEAVNPEAIGEFQGRTNRSAQRLRAADLKAVQNALVDVSKGGPEANAARAMLTPLAGAQGLPGGFAGDLARSDPADVKRQAELETQGALNIDNMGRRDKERKEREAADRKAAQARIKGRNDRNAAEAKFFDDKDRDEARANKEKADHEEAVAEAERDARDAGRQMDLAEARDKKAADRAADQRRRQQQKVGEQQAAFRLQMESQQLERGYQNEINSAHAMNATADVIAEINRRHTMLSRQLQDAANRMRESTIGSGLDN